LGFRRRVAGVEWIGADGLKALSAAAPCSRRGAAEGERCERILSACMTMHDRSGWGETMDDASKSIEKVNNSNRLRLTIELVPATAWGANLRDVLTRQGWDALRRHVFAQFGNRCAICGAGGRLHCHEVWRYDDARHVQTLEGCLALCALCHHVKHLGMAHTLAEQGKLDYERVVRHFMEVNGCDRATFERHRAAAFAQFEERSRHEWTTDFGFAPPQPPATDDSR
jgi:hypothetical protein